MLIDSHCHLANFYRKGCLEEVLENAAEAGVGRIVTIGTSVKDWEINRQLAAQYPSIISYTVGLHPTDIDDDWEEQLASLPAFFNGDPAHVGMGEIGLDHFHLPKSKYDAEAVKSRQVLVFKQQLELATGMDCPVVVHSRNSFHECVKVIDEMGADWSRIVFHCFADGPEEIRILNERGGRGSFTGIVTYKNADPIREALLTQGMEKLMVETDAPYMAPIPMRGKRNEPAFVRHTAEFCARLMGVEESEFFRQTTANAKQFFNLP